MYILKRYVSIPNVHTIIITVIYLFLYIIFLSGRRWSAPDKWCQYERENDASLRIHKFVIGLVGSTQARQSSKT